MGLPLGLSYEDVRVFADTPSEVQELLRVTDDMLDLHRDLGRCWVNRQKRRVIQGYTVMLAKRAHCN